MSKSNWFALIAGTLILSSTCAAYAQVESGLPTLVITKPPQPKSSIALAGALYVPFTRVDLTARGGDMTVTDITVQHTGVADDEMFDEILVLDSDGTELASGTLDEDHIVHFTEPILIPRNNTLHLTVAANMIDDLEEFDGQAPSFTIIDIQASGYIPVHL